MAKDAVLVLGATGRIGRLLQLCPPEGLALRLQARRAQAAAGKPDAGWRLFDPLEDPAALARAATGAAAVLCLAGPVPGRGAGEMADHIRLGEAAVRAGAGAGARVLLASSAAVYGAGSGLLAEDAPLHPASAYGAAKAEMEARAAALGAELGVPVCSLRIGNTAGFDAILGGWRPGFSLDRFADGATPRRSYIGARSLAQVLGALLQRPALPPALNVAQPGTVEMAALLQAAGLPFAARPAPGTAIPEVALDVSRLQALLPVPLAPADAAQLAAEWAGLEPQLRQEQSRR
ncbi:NAD-dependent epimerase/dehydratase family protein [Leisingera daeponensis]|uniref:NAD-dependent epimerase/dehydratase family protein n=1 Tax=Leisingera daeponensis TaxID=405746 RepID=A0ABS7NIH9_9RHOB|nr:NAD-dependent epimerase/dehydratase family protein [Leisingera daeponensis]MBY6141008.1 NAD-dependent epimerase/dehydratase family protein [Leisingera daeponensis]